MRNGRHGCPLPSMDPNEILRVLPRIAYCLGSFAYLQPHMVSLNMSPGNSASPLLKGLLEDYVTDL